jgi:hypothetical protein
LEQTLKKIEEDHDYKIDFDGIKVIENNTMKDDTMEKLKVFHLIIFHGAVIFTVA